MKAGSRVSGVHRRMAEYVLAAEAFPDLAFGRRLRRTPLDVTLRPAEVLWARWRRRNPGLPRWRKRAARSWVTAGPEENPRSASKLRPVARPTARDVTLFAVTAAWNEDDIIYATIMNLWSEGADRVFMIDDDSDDGTCAEARAAGATVRRTQSDGRYSEAVRSAAINDLITAETAAADTEVWWLVVDADEFPRGADGATVREMVLALPEWVDAVGSRVLDHVPDSTSSYAARSHPVTAFPLARWYVNPYCASGHWKHQLMRIRYPREVLPLPGSHVLAPAVPRQLREPQASLLMHHFPLRDLQRTTAKFAQAAAPDGRYAKSPDPFTRRRLRERMAQLDLFYADAAHLTRCSFPGEPLRSAKPLPWQELVTPAERAWPARPAPGAARIRQEC